MDNNKAQHLLDLNSNPKIKLFTDLGFKLYKKVNDIFIMEYTHHEKSRRFHKGVEVEKLIMITAGKKYFKIHTMSIHEENKKIMIYKNRFNNLSKPKEISKFVSTVMKNLISINTMETYLNKVENQITKYFNVNLFELNLKDHFKNIIEEEIIFPNGYSYEEEYKTIKTRYFECKLNIYNFITNEENYIEHFFIDLKHIKIKTGKEEVIKQLENISKLKEYLNEYHSQIKKYNLILKLR